MLHLCATKFIASKTHTAGISLLCPEFFKVSEDMQQEMDLKMQLVVSECCQSRCIKFSSPNHFFLTLDIGSDRFIDHQGAFSWLHPIKLAYNPCWLEGWLILTANSFSQHKPMCQPYYYSELAISFRAVTETIASTCSSTHPLKVGIVNSSHALNQYL